MLKIRNYLVSCAALITSASTLVCCALPALLISVGAGASMASLVSAVPQLIWLSTHKLLVFGLAGACLAVAGVLRLAPVACPVDVELARHCGRAKRMGSILFAAAASCFFLGLFFAVILPRI